MATTARRLWCEYAAIGPNVVADVLVSLDGGFVGDVETGVEAPPGVELLGGLTMPGFANAHSHAFHRALRGRTHGVAEGSGGAPGNFWTWREQMYALASRLTPQNYLALARATFAEMVLAGYTCVGEFHYVHHPHVDHPVDPLDAASRYDDPNAMGHAIVEAAQQAGIRLTLLDACYLRAGAKQPPRPEQARFSDGTADEWSNRVAVLRDQCAGVANVAVGAAIHSVRAVDADSMAVVARFAHDNGMSLHAHVSEQLAENEEAMAEFRCSPMEILAQQGALSDRFTAVHATHVSEADIELLALSRSTCCFCPTTERDLADGIGPSGQLRRAGVALSIGSDQHAVIDPFEEMRGIELDERLSVMQRGTHAPAELVVAGSSAGYRSLGWDAPGFDVGATADFTTVSLDSVRLAGAPSAALVDAVVFAASAADVSNVIVGGRTVVSGGRHISIDVASELRSSIASLYGEDAL